MFSLFIQNWFDNAIARAVGRTFIHSLWQGLLLTIVAALIILFTRRTAPALRYQLLSGLFVLFIGIACFTLVRELQQDTRPATSVILTENFQGSTETSVIQQGPVVELTVQDRFKTWFDQYISWIMAAWFLVFFIKCIRLAGGLDRVKRLCRYNSYSIPVWQRRVDELTEILQINQKVLLFESVKVTVPIVVGFFKPVILLPVGLLSNLPIDQVEAILLHELAHIRRKDYLFNLLQCVVEKIFFFNPAVLWLSSRIREEREICCDAIAVGITRNKLAFIHALLSFQEGRPWDGLQPYTRYTHAFPGRKNHLLHRVKRIAFNDNKNLNAMEKIFLGAGLVVTSLVALAFTSDHNKDAVTSKAAIEKIVNYIPAAAIHAASPKDTVPEKKLNGSITTIVNGKEYRIELKDNVVKELFIDGQKIDDSKIGDYKEITDKIIIETKIKAAEANEESKRAKEMAVESRKMVEREKIYRDDAEKKFKEQKELEKGERDREKEEKLKEKMEAAKEKEEMNKKMLEERKGEKMKAAKEEEEMSKKMLEEQHKMAKELEKQKKEMEKEAKESKKNHDRKMELMKKDHERELKQLKEQTDKNFEQQKKNRKDVEGLRKQFEKEKQEKKESHKKIEEKHKLQQQKVKQEQEKRNREFMEKHRKQKFLLEQRQKEFKLQANKMKEASREKSQEAKRKSNEFRDNLANDLVSENIVKSRGEISSIEFTNEALIVNGVKQPESIHKKFKDKYAKGNSQINYRWLNSRKD